MDKAQKPSMTTPKKVFAWVAVLGTVVGLVISQQITTLQAASEGQDFLKVQEVTTGDGFATALTTDGKVYSRGLNNQGQAGVNPGDTINAGSWKAVEIKEPVSNISASYDHTVALTKTGHVFTWGSNDTGQQGNGTTSPVYTPIQVSASLRYSQISAGPDFVLALDTDGKLWSWGANTAGQLGDGTTKNHSKPKLASTTTVFSKVYAGKNFGLALTPNGELYSWGANESGQLGDGTTTPRTSPAPTTPGLIWSQLATNSNGSTVLAIDGNGWLYSWGANPNGQLGLGVNWRQQQVEENERVAREIETIKNKDAQARQNLIDQCVAQKDAEDAKNNPPTPPVTPTPTPTPTPSPSNTPTPTPTPQPTQQVQAPAIDPAAVDHTSECTTEVDKTFKPTDTSNIKPATITEPALPGNSANPVQVTRDYQFTQVALGTQNGFAVDVLGRLYAWGADINGQTGINIDDSKSHTQVPVQILTKVKNVSAGDQYSLATGNDGTLYAWGANRHGELLADPKTTPKLLTPTNKGSGFDSVVAGSGTGYGFQGHTVFGWGDNSAGQIGANSKDKQVYAAAELTSKLQTVAPYSSGSVGLDITGRLMFWGTNTNGEFGNAETSKTPIYNVNVKTIDKFKDVSSGYLYSLAVDTDGQLWGWGSTGQHTLGSASTGASMYPIAVGIGEKLDTVTAGETIAVATDKAHVYVWGGVLNTTVQTYDMTDVKTVSVGDKHAVILQKNGTAWLWSADGTGAKEPVEPMKLVELDSSVKLKNVTAGKDLTLGLTTDNHLVGWGTDPNKLIIPDETATQKIVFTQISLSKTYALGVDRNGVVWGWGYNPYGVFGLTSTQPTPKALPLTTSKDN